MRRRILHLRREWTGIHCDEKQWSMDALSPGAGLWCLTIPRYLICTSHAYLPDCYSLTFIKRAPCTALAPPGRLGPGEVLEDLERHGKDMATSYSAWLRERASSRPKSSKNRPQDARPPWPPQPPPRGQRPRQRPPPLTRPPASPSNSSAAASVPSAAVTSAVEMWWREGAQGCEVGMFQSQGFHRRLRVSREWSGPPMASACGAAPWHGRAGAPWHGRRAQLVCEQAQQASEQAQ